MIPKPFNKPCRSSSHKTPTADVAAVSQAATQAVVVVAAAVEAAATSASTGASSGAVAASAPRATAESVVAVAQSASSGSASGAVATAAASGVANVQAVVQAVAVASASGSSTGAVAAVTASTNPTIVLAVAAVTAATSTGSSSGATAGAIVATAAGNAVTANTVAVEAASTVAAEVALVTAEVAVVAVVGTQGEVVVDPVTETVETEVITTTSFTIQLSYGTVTFSVTNGSISGPGQPAIVATQGAGTGTSIGAVISSNGGALTDLTLPNVALGNNLNRSLSAVELALIKAAIDGLQGSVVVSVPGNVITVSPSS